MNYCKICSEENLEIAKFCKNCGYEFLKKEIKLCQQCNAENEKTAIFCNKCAEPFTKTKIVPEKKVAPSQKTTISYRFYYTPQGGHSKRLLYELFVDKQLIHSGLLKDGFDFYYDIKKGKDNYHLVELNITRKAWAMDNELGNFSKNIDFDAVKGELIEFIYHLIPLPLINDYFTIK